MVLIKVVITEFHKVIFAYTLPFYGLSTDRLCRKENKLKLLYSQEALFHDKVGGGGGGGGVVHDSLMQSVMFNHYNQLLKNVTKSVYCRITINLHSCPQLHIILKKRNDNSETFRAIATEKCMSPQMAKKCAGSGLLFMHLQLAFQVMVCMDLMMLCVKRLTTNPVLLKIKLLLLRKCIISNTNYLIY